MLYNSTPSPMPDIQTKTKEQNVVDWFVSLATFEQEKVISSLLEVHDKHLRDNVTNYTREIEGFQKLKEEDTQRLETLKRIFKQ